MEIPDSIRIGEKLTKGQGVGGDPKKGGASAEESQAEIQSKLMGADMIFVAAGMGGGTGTGAAPVVARIAKETTDALVVGVVTKPFEFEGPERMKHAQEGIDDLRLRIILDDGLANGALILGRESAEAFLGQTMADVQAATKDDGGEAFLAGLRSKMLGRQHTFTGRAMIDAQGALLMADKFELTEINLEESANEVRERWEVFA